MTGPIRRAFALLSISLALVSARSALSGTGGKVRGLFMLHRGPDSSMGTRSHREPGRAPQPKPSEDERGPDDDSPAEDTRPEDQPGPRNAAEWTTLGISALIVVGLVGAALYEHVGRTEPAGARVSVQVDLAAAEQRDGLYYVPYTVVNMGSQAAESVSVVFEIKRGEETVEESDAEIAFLANSGSATGELVTPLDPAAHAIEARVASLQLP